MNGWYTLPWGLSKTSTDNATGSQRYGDLRGLNIDNKLGIKCIALFVGILLLCYLINCLATYSTLLMKHKNASHIPFTSEGLKYIRTMDYRSS